MGATARRCAICAAGMPRSPPSCRASGRGGCGRSIAAPVGAALASLHVAGARLCADAAQCARAGTAGRRCWSARARGPTRCRRAWPRELDGALAAILAAWPQGLPTGHIHADLFPDNVFFLDGRLSGLIDFYFAATDILAYDVAVCLNAWCFEPDFSFNVTKARAHARAPMTRRARCRTPSARRCRCCARVRRSASC